MSEQVHNILEAAKTLVGTVGTPQERLAKGFKAFRQATISSNDWSGALWEKYNCICDTLLAGGTWQKTIDRMDLKTACQCATQISKAMKKLAIAVEFARRPVVIPAPITTSLAALDLSGSP
jgi:hypothetical protein